MDGRVQLPVNAYLRRRFGAIFVDTVTEPGPNGILAEGTAPNLIESILDRVAVSVHHHGSGGVGIVGHADCAGNPRPRGVQVEQLRKARQRIAKRFPGIEVVLLWVDESWRVEEVG